MDNIVEVSQAVGLKGWQVIAFAIITYLVCMFLQYWLSLLVKNKDVSNDRKMKIADLSISAGVELFQGLDHLRSFQKTEVDQMLDQIQSLYLLLNSNKVLFSKSLYTKADMILSYFSDLCADYTKKDIKREMSLFEDYIKAFNE